MDNTVQRRTSNRYFAGALHAGISLIVLAGLFWLLVGFWYPGNFFATSGGWQGIRIVACVDVILGPLLTLVVFDCKKSVKELVTDIGLIVLIQLLALSWGVYALFYQRPAAVVFWDGSFMTVPAQAYEEQNYPLEKLSFFGGEKPVLVYAQKPSRLEDLKKMLMLMKQNQLPPHYQPQLYRPLKEHFSEISEFKLDINKITASHPDVLEDIDHLLKANHYQAADQLWYFLLQSKYQNNLMAFTPQGQFLGYIDLNSVDAVQ